MEPDFLPRLARRLAATGALSLVAACGGSGPAAPGQSGATITITASGISPREVVVAAGLRVTFRNGDTRPHAISSDPVQTHSDCPSINEVGNLLPNHSGSTGLLGIVRTCGFHDHNDENNPAFKGRIIVQ
jgi:hypothetical protein